ncbi:MAG: hypothetical protein DWQ15_03460 [Proteobacteria bacterium]|nr:MAG: hypothetical protein DWQ15_03460 [Pseudomonadota bacterium]
MTDEKDEKAVEPNDDQTNNIEDAVVVEDLQEAVSDAPAEDAVADAVEAIETERKSSGVLPLVVAGFICAGLGFGAAILSQPSNPIWPVHPDMAQFRDETTGQITGIDTRLNALAGRLIDVDQRPVGDVFQSDLDELTTGFDQRFLEIASQLENFDKRLAALEKSTIESAIPDELVAQYQDEVKRLKETLEAQRESLQQFMSETAETANEVTQRAKDTVARGILAQIRAAIDAGGPFDSAIKEFDEQVGEVLPNQLRSLAEEGVQTYQELRDSFAEAARSALNAARDELNESEGFAGIGNYLRKQFQARSVKPKAGDDADAVLSRAEQALRENDLNGALNELDALPDAARDQMQPWIDQARERQDALEQLDILSQEIGN